MLAATLAALALAAAPLDADSAGPACWAETPLTAELVADARQGEMLWRPADARAPALLVAHLSYLRDAAVERGAPSGTILFVQDGPAWRAFVPQEGESALGVFVSRSRGQAMLITQRQVAGPQPSFTIARAEAGLTAAVCAQIDFPAALNEPVYALETLALEELQISARGRGRLVGSALIDAEDGSAGRLTWWAYETRDGGHSWSAPRALPGKPRPLRGDLAPVSAPAPQDAIAALADFAEGR